jgi:biopolymer transport protein ExbB/TolQ
VFAERVYLWAVVGVSVAALVVIILVIVIVVLVRRRPGSESERDNSDLSSLNDLSANIANLSRQSSKNFWLHIINCLLLPGTLCYKI